MSLINRQIKNILIYHSTNNKTNHKKLTINKIDNKTHCVYTTANITVCDILFLTTAQPEIVLTL